MKLNQKGFGPVEVVLIIVIIVILGFIGWFVWDANKVEDSAETETAVTTPAPVTEETTTDEETNEGYLEIAEWDIKLKEGTLTSDVEYVIKDNNTAYLSTATLQKKAGGGKCKPDSSTGIMYRGKAGYDYNGTGTAIDKYNVSYVDDDGKTVTKKSVKVGEYYYVWQSPQASCYSPTDENIKLLEPYTQALSDLVYTVEAL